MELWPARLLRMAVLLAIAAALVVPACGQTNAAAAYHVSPERLELSKKYLYGALLWGTASQLWLLVVLAALVVSGASARLRNWAEGRVGALPEAGPERAAQASTSRTVGVFSFAFITLVILAELPFALYLDFFRERAFGFEHRTLLEWFGDWGKAYLVTVVLAVPALIIAYAVVRRAQQRWWLWAWALTVAFSIFAIAIEPVFIEPLFNQFTPVKNVALREQILNMAHRAGIPAKDVYEVDRSRQSAHTNAYVVGLLGTQRIVLYDTILQAETPAEIELVMGHEMGHYMLHHVWKGIAFFAALSFALFWLLQLLYGRVIRRWPRLAITSIADVAGLPLVALLLGVMLFFCTPLTNAFSRRQEHQADAFGLRIAPDPVAAITGFEKDVNTDLIDPDPPRWIEWWFFTHPSNRHRIEFAEQYCRRHGIQVPPDIYVE